MNLFRNRIVRLPIVAIGAATWLAISNHCALAAIEGPAKMPMPSCHGTAPASHLPAKHNQKNGIECCKVLRATLLTGSKSAVGLNQSHFAIVAYVVAVLPLPAQSVARAPLELDTGPPLLRSFAESVLQRSILAHAPPVSLS